MATYRRYSIAQERHAEVHEPVLKEELPEVRAQLLPRECCDSQHQHHKVNAHRYPICYINNQQDTRANRHILTTKLASRKTWFVKTITQPLASGEYAASTINMPRQRIAQCAMPSRASIRMTIRFWLQSAALAKYVSVRLVWEEKKD